VNNYNDHGRAESIPLSMNTLKFKIAAQNSAVTRIKRVSHDSLCNKVKELLTASSKEISLCDRSPKVV